jgi:hypothetical protein
LEKERKGIENKLKKQVKEKKWLKGLGGGGVK